MHARDDLLVHARSLRPEVRAKAGEQLAAFVGLADVDEAPISLLRDPDDTYPTAETATALLERRDVPGLRLLARALGDADEDSTDHILDAMYAVTQTRSEHDALRARCLTLAEDEDHAVRSGIAVLIEWFSRT